MREFFSLSLHSTFQGFFLFYLILKLLNIPWILRFFFLFFSNIFFLYFSHLNYRKLLVFLINVTQIKKCKLVNLVRTKKIKKYFKVYISTHFIMLFYYYKVDKPQLRVCESFLNILHHLTLRSQILVYNTHKRSHFI